MASPNILVIGSANADLVMRVPRCPKPGESIIGSDFTTVPGGKGANQAVAAARLGAATTFVGTVGNDDLGAMMRSTLSANGVDIEHVFTSTQAATGTAIILIGDDGQNSISVAPGANGELSSGNIEALTERIAAADVLLLQLEIDLDAVATALAIARANDVLTVLDAGPAQAIPDALVSLPDIISPNETEVEAITGITIDSSESVRDAAQALIDRGARAVVLKLGQHGAYYRGPDGHELSSPAFKVNPIDTVAAGDAFTAALALRWQEEGPGPALRHANAAGALATTKSGAQDAMPTADEVAAFLKEQ